MNLTNQITIQADAIIRDIYEGCRNLGHVNSFIQPGNHTSDFALPENMIMRAKEEKGHVFYHVFRKG